MKTTKAIINVNGGKLKIRTQDEEIMFSVFEIWRICQNYLFRISK